MQIAIHCKNPPGAVKILESEREAGDDGLAAIQRSRIRLTVRAPCLARPVSYAFAMTCSCLCAPPPRTPLQMIGWSSSAAGTAGAYDDDAEAEYGLDLLRRAHRRFARRSRRMKNAAAAAATAWRTFITVPDHCCRRLHHLVSCLSAAVVIQ